MPMSALGRGGVLDRRARLARLAANPRPQVLVIGGGINGISTFRELAAQGVSVVLVERGDWCEAASGALSRMIHGGLRYLETGEFALVRESVRERDRLLANASHLVAQLPTTVPLDGWHGGWLATAQRALGLRERPGRRGGLLVKLGLSFYDFYTRGNARLPRHRLHGARATRAAWPDFGPWAKCSATYHDAWVSHPERLGVELVMEGEAACARALAINHLAVESIEGECVRLVDRFEGGYVELRPELIVNACGAWVDKLNARVVGLEAPALIGGTKGAHLILDHPHLLKALDGRMVYYENREGRVCILFPYLGRVLVGSTDIRVEDPDQARVSEEERDYILASLRFVFPAVEVTPDQVLYAFSGVRPLPRSDAQRNGRISRGHACHWRQPAGGAAMLCLVGGKWTTFRAFGAEAADRVLARLGVERRVATERLAIGGGRDFPPAGERREAWCRALAERHGVAQARVALLAARYGSRTAQLLEWLAGEDTALAELPDYGRSELAWLIEYEQVATLADLLIRRTSIAIEGRLTPAVAAAVAQLASARLGWSAARRCREIERLGAEIRARHGLCVTAERFASAEAPRTSPFPPSPGAPHADFDQAPDPSIVRPG